MDHLCIDDIFCPLDFPFDPMQEPAFPFDSISQSTMLFRSIVYRSIKSFKGASVE